MGSVVDQSVSETCTFFHYYLSHWLWESRATNSQESRNLQGGDYRHMISL